MWLQTVIKKQRGESPEIGMPGTIEMIPERPDGEIQELRRKVAELQAVVVREKRAEDILRES